MAWNNGLTVYNNTSLQNNQTGIREDLADYIAVVDAKSTPLTSMIPKGKSLGNTTFSWQVDAYSNAQAGGTQDGADVTITNTNANASAVRSRYSNVSQVFRRVHRTGFIADTMNVAAVSSETARAVAKRLVELKRDIEATIACVNQAMVIESENAASLTASLGVWMNTTNSAGSGAPVSGSQFVPASGAVSTTTSANITETTVQDVLTAIYTRTGSQRDYDGIFGTTLKRAFTLLTSATSNSLISTNSVSDSTHSITTNFPAIRTFNMDASSGTYTSSVDVFEGDFGTIRIHPTTFIGTTNGTAFAATAYKGYVAPMEMLELRYGKLPEVKDLPDAGGGPIKLVQAIAGLVVKNPGGFGMFNGAS